MPHIRKATAGSDNFGNEWKKDGALVEVPHEQAVQLLAIEDGGFSLADGDEDVHSEDAPAPVDEENGNVVGAGKTKSGNHGATLYSGQALVQGLVDGIASKAADANHAEPTPVGGEFSEVRPTAPVPEPDAPTPEQQAPQPVTNLTAPVDSGAAQSAGDTQAPADPKATPARKTPPRKATASKPQD